MARIATCQNLSQPCADQMFASRRPGLLCSDHEARLATDVLPLEPVGGTAQRPLAQLWVAPSPLSRCCGGQEPPAWTICLAEMSVIPSDWNFRQRTESLVLLTRLYRVQEGRVALTSRRTAWKPEACCEHSRGGNKVMFLDSASLEVMFLIWTLRPHIKKKKKKAPLSEVGMIL